jgi:O-antigen ligase
MWAVDSEVALDRLPTVLSLVLLYLAAVCFRPSRSELYWVCALMVLGGVLAAALAYFFGLHEQAHVTSPMARGRMVLADMDSNPGALGRVLLLPLTLAIAGFVGGRGMLPRALAVGCAAVIGLGIFLSMSRGTVVAMVAVLLVLLYRARVRWHIVAVMVVLLVVAAFMPDAFYARFDALISGRDDTGSGRLEIWRTGLMAFERSGFFGAGLYNFPVLYGAYIPGPRAAPHNIYLATLIDFGVPGVVMLLAAIGSGLLAVRRIRLAGRSSIAVSALEAACIGTLVSALFVDVLWTKSFWLVWILLSWAMHSEDASKDVPVPQSALLPR